MLFIKMIYIDLVLLLEGGRGGGKEFIQSITTTTQTTTKEKVGSKMESKNERK